MAVFSAATLIGMMYVDSSIEKAMDSSQEAYQLVNEVASLNRLATEMNKAGIVRIKQQWKMKIDSLHTAIKKHPAEPQILSKMLHQVQQLDVTFTKMLAMYEKEVASDFSGNFTQARFYRLNHISILLKSLASLVNEIAVKNYDRVRVLQQNRDYFLGAVGLAWFFALAFWSYTLWIGIMIPMRKLLKSIDVVSKGDLSCRVLIDDGENEINNLMRSFNGMLDRLQDLTVSRKALLDATEQERSRIGRELHEGICQTLTAVRLKLSNLEISPLNFEQIQEVSACLSQTSKEIRLIVKELRPAMLDELGLVSTLNWFAKENKDRIITKLYVNVPETVIPARLRTPIFRIVQEATSNAIRHGEADTIHIQMNCTRDILDVTIEDNGKGFDPTRHYVGNGLITIRERVEAERGEFFLDTTKGRGCFMSASFPLNLSDG
ncbi:ATP-binding protein [Pseudodesulfovibrio sp. JC047]|uniref:ATP-binding protein n=1 Tax=Pseudodesulfovibrio sp. JC047 TaxID=2683199 RepID=UPI00193F24E6